MMNQTTALEALRLKDQASRTEIVTAYNRLARRYPLQQFPERHTRLLEAKTALLNPELGFKDLLFEETIDLSWLNRYAAEPTASKDTPVGQSSGPKQCLDALFRSHFKKSVDLFSVDVGMPEDFARILEEIGPDNLQELMERFGLPG